MRAYPLGGDRGLVVPSELLNGALVITQVLLASDQHNRKTATEVLNFGVPLLFGKKKTSSGVMLSYVHLVPAFLKLSILPSPGRFQASLENQWRNK